MPRRAVVHALSGKVAAGGWRPASCSRAAAPTEPDPRLHALELTALCNVRHAEQGQQGRGEREPTHCWWLLGSWPGSALPGALQVRDAIDIWKHTVEQNTAGVSRASLHGCRCRCAAACCRRACPPCLGTPACFLACASAQADAVYLHATMPEGTHSKQWRARHAQRRLFQCAASRRLRLLLPSRPSLHDDPAALLLALGQRHNHRLGLRGQPRQGHGPGVGRPPTPARQPPLRTRDAPHPAPPPTPHRPTAPPPLACV